MYKRQVLETFTDSFASWQFGELDNVDSIKNLQNGSRTRFPLEFNKELLSFETNNSEIDLNAVLLIFVNGVIQEPGQHYSLKVVHHLPLVKHLAKMIKLIYSSTEDLVVQTVFQLIL